MDDLGIIELYWQRNGAAIDETDKKYGALCRGLAVRILGDERDGEECVNDTYMATWQAIPTERPNKLAAFLAAITRRLSIDVLRKRSAVKRGMGEAERALDELAETLPARDNVEREVEQRELTEAIDRFLDTLGASERDMFVCRYWLCASIKDIARRFNASESRVKSSLMRTRNRLKKYLGEEGYI